MYAGMFANPAKHLLSRYKRYYLSMRMDDSAPIHCKVADHNACVPDCRGRPDNLCSPDLPNYCTSQTPEACQAPLKGQALPLLVQP